MVLVLDDVERKKEERKKKMTKINDQKAEGEKIESTEGKKTNGCVFEVGDENNDGYDPDSQPPDKTG